jgi:hypothetical protein
LRHRINQSVLKLIQVTQLSFSAKNWQWIVGTVIGSGALFSILKAIGIIK